MNISEALEEEFIRKKIDRNLTLTILNNYNQGLYDSVEPVVPQEIPALDGKSVIDATSSLSLSFSVTHFYQRLHELLPELDPKLIGTVDSERVTLSAKDLETLGILLYPKTAYGILNGGSATSYIDIKKNHSFSPELFDICESEFAQISFLSQGKAKGITPAFIQPDGTPGPDFIELKMRSLLIQAYTNQLLTDNKDHALFPLFQMVSIYNKDQLEAKYKEYNNSPLLKPLIKTTGIHITAAGTGVQPLLAAFTHSKYGGPKSLFTEAWGEKDTLLPLPGGHGQNFTALKEVYRELYKHGTKFVYLSNVDNLANTVNPIYLAYFALSEKQGAFEFSFKTAVDKKGGILVRDKSNRLNCADIGPAISPKEVEKEEKKGRPILFNCATGLFDLTFLAQEIEYIIDELPMRFSDQDKDPGLYSQAEQITWEIMGMMDNPLIFGVDKYDRFLASKLILENLMTSGIKKDHPNYPKKLLPAALHLHNGLIKQLSTNYGLKLENNRWVPKTLAELEKEIMHHLKGAIIGE